MRKNLNKLAWCIVVFITLTNLITSLFSTSANTVYATDTTESIENIDENADDDSIFDGIGSFIGVTADGVVGILTLLARIPVLLYALSVASLMTGIANIGGSKIKGLLTPDDLFFNRVGLTEIDFFNFSGETSAIKTIRMNIATWYYILRVLSIVILLAVLIYIGIRMAISTIASEKAQYKRMLTDWVVSFALLFLLNYVIMFTIEVNNALIAMLSGPAKVTLGDGVILQLSKMVVTPGTATKSWGALIVLWSLVGMTLGFLLLYVRRMLTIGFLIIISPLITITYSIDKVKDSTAQALNTWMKEFMFNVLIQPFHCIIYLAFVSTVMNTLQSTPSLAKLLLVAICMKFVWQAEKIIRKIFGFHQASSLGEAVAAMATVKALGTAARKITTKGISKTKFGQNVAGKVGNNRFIKAAKDIAKDSEVKKAVVKVGKEYVKINRAATPMAVGVSAAAFEMGANSSANALQVGAEFFGVAHDRIYGAQNQPGSKKNIEQTQKDLRRFSDLISRNNNFNFANYTSNNTNKNNLKTYAQGLIGTNINYLDNRIQQALNQLTQSQPNDYNVTTPAGLEHLKQIQDSALDENLDFNDPSTNPLGHAWTTEEKQVVTSIQIKNLAGAVNGLHDQYKAAGTEDPKQEVDDFIDEIK